MSLLDVAGKGVARNIQMRLLSVAESEHLKFQCDFRKGQRSTDSYSLHSPTIGRKINRTWGEIVFVFVDLEKAYDSVPQIALWMSLKKLGVPDQMEAI